MFDEKAFTKLNLSSRADLLREAGTYIGARYYGAYHVHLYAVHGVYVEMYLKLGINLIEMIEIQKNQKIVELYAEGVKFEIDFS